MAPRQPLDRIELRSSLDERVLRDVLRLLDETTAVDGHRPVGEHKYSHLKVGAERWIGVLAYKSRDDDDRLVGYAHTRWNTPGARPRMAVEVVVHPDRRGVGIAERLLSEVRGVLGRAGGGLLYLWVHRVEDPRDTLAARMGFTVQRELAFMARPLDPPLDPPATPQGVTIRPFRPGHDEDALLAVNNAAFEGHPENGGWDRATLDARLAMPWVDPGGILLAVDAGGELLGFHWTKWHSHDSDEVPAHEPVGEVYVLAIAPRAQGSGLGRALLRAGLAHLHGRGCRQAVLYVDCASTGAVTLYESEGFVTAYREVCYEEQVAPLVEEHAGELTRPAF